MDDWILEHVVPSVAASSCGTMLSKLLGKALLWMIFSEKSAWVPASIVERVKTTCHQLLGKESNANLIEKRLLIVAGDDATSLINEVAPVNAQQQQLQQGQQQQQEEQQPLQLGSNIHAQSNCQMMLTLLNQVSSLQQALGNLAQDIAQAREANRVNIMVQSCLVQSNLNCVTLQLIYQLNNAAATASNANNNAAGGSMGGGTATAPAHAELSPMPGSLCELWREHQEGIGGQKAVHLFMREERGKNKHKHHQREVIWDHIRLLVNVGCTAQMACDCALCQHVWMRRKLWL